jgi:hypothetical protein
MSEHPVSSGPEPRGDVSNQTQPPVLTPIVDGSVAEARGSSWVWALVFGVSAALIAAFITWKVGENMYEYYRPSDEALRSRFDFRARNREQLVADQKNAAIACGTFGALMGLLAGAAGGFARGSIKSGAIAAGAGLVLGGLAALLVSSEVVPIVSRYYSDDNPSLLLPVLVRGGIWAVTGITAGLALGYGWQGSRAITRVMIGGLVGSILGTVVFEAVNAVVFPADRNDNIIPSSDVTRLMEYVCVAVAIALGAVLLGREGQRLASGTSQAEH